MRYPPPLLAALACAAGLDATVIFAYPSAPVSWTPALGAAVITSSVSSVSSVGRAVS
ncbi:hypothetical protein [Streptomyces broussonetiae]|uniref:hypothetical protein n=1 Tax=Streptomyces broussonetiae TaxID=2686304 RepID=UPI0018EECE2A|nr:hypothetical protein [Streptomyces broussonetiae]